MTRTIKRIGLTNHRFGHDKLIYVMGQPKNDIEPSKKLPQYIAAAVGNIIAAGAGTGFGWSSPTLPKLSISSEESSWAGSLVAMGAIFGPLCAGIVMDKLGRKVSLLIICGPFLLSWLLIGLYDATESLALIYVGRIIQGFSIGGVYTILPMYIGEICEPEIRGALGSFMQVFISLGILFGYSVGPYVSYVLLVCLSAIFVVVFFVLMIFIPESPYQYVAKNNLKEASKSLQWMRGQSEQAVEAELKQIQESVEEMMKNKASIRDLFTVKGNIKGLYISTGLVALQQLTGINAVLFYGQSIFQEAGGGLDSSVSTIIIGAVMLAASCVTPIVVDRLGRKVLLMFSATGMLVTLVPLGVYFNLKRNSDVSDIGWLPVTSLIVYISVYSVGFGPLPWAVMGEIFPSNVKGIASTTTASFCWVLGFLITKFFSNIAESLGSDYAFWIFAIFAILADVFLFFLLPETKGKTLQEIQDILNQ